MSTYRRGPLSTDWLNQTSYVEKVWMLSRIVSCIYYFSLDNPIFYSSICVHPKCKVRSTKQDSSVFMKHSFFRNQQYWYTDLFMPCLIIELPWGFLNLLSPHFIVWIDYGTCRMSTNCRFFETTSTNIRFLHIPAYIPITYSNPSPMLKSLFYEKPTRLESSNILSQGTCIRFLDFRNPETHPTNAINCPELRVFQRKRN